MLKFSFHKNYICLFWQTIFLLPAFVAGKVERVIEGKRIPLKPGDRLLPVEEKRLGRLHVTVSNMLDDPEHEKAIVDQIKKRVLEQLSQDPSTKFQIKRPIINTEGIRFLLVTAAPAKIAESNFLACNSAGEFGLPVAQNLFALDKCSAHKGHHVTIF